MLEHIVVIREALVTARFEAEHAMMYDEPTDRSWMGDADMVARIDAALAALDSWPAYIASLKRQLAEAQRWVPRIDYQSGQYPPLPITESMVAEWATPEEDEAWQHLSGAPVATVPPAAILDALGRCLEDLLLWHDGDASNMSDQLFEDYVDVRAWLNEQPVGFLNQQEKS